MATTREILVNAATRHSVFTERFAGGVTKDIIPNLIEARDSALKALTGRELTELSKTRLKAAIKKLNDDLIDIYKDMGKTITKEMKAFAKEEAGFNVRMFDNATKAGTTFEAPASTQVTAAVFGSPISMIDDSTTMSKALDNFSSTTRKRIVQTIRNGVIQGQTNQEMTRAVKQATGRLQRNQAAALVQTLTKHTAAGARSAVVANNDDILSGEEWISVLDANTTETCAALDKQVFPLGEGPFPPIHWNCRSERVPVVKSEFSISSSVTRERPAVGAEGVETVSGRTTYNSWLKAQSKEFQEEVLGVDKAKLFRSGGLSVTKFVDKKFRPLTLEQLKKTEPLAFKKAGL